MPADRVTGFLAASALALGCTTSTDETPPPGENTPTPPPGSYLGGESCTQCLAGACSRPVFVCESDALCREQLACRKQCADPACHYACRVLESPNAALDAVDAALDAVDGCASFECATECRVGGGFDCGHYDRPVLEGSVQTRVRVLPAFGDPIAGVEVVACSSRNPPCDELASGVTDVEGRVTFNVDANWTYHRTVEIRNPSGDYGNVVAWGGGLIEREPGDVTLTPSFHAKRMADYNQHELLPERPWMQGTVFDCNHRPARGLTLTVATEDPLVVIEPTLNAYWLNEVARTLSAGTFYALNLPEGPRQISAHNPDTGQVVVNEPFVFRAGWHYMGPLQPSPAQRDLAANR